ncbi:hypothetical protein CO614_10980 [Lysobacteraceae bacterium NML120232]|nr:hypothetical protein CO614_10980 [Xanthomonadaceae bacterium NML120232]PJK11024.1 hypothetical protein CO608_00690 [Xanthomonadaceae bacterium NML08-0793]
MTEAWEDDSPQGQAAFWWARLRADDVAPEDYLAHARWLAGDAENVRAWNEVQALWLQLDQLAPRKKPNWIKQGGLLGLAVLVIGWLVLLGPNWLDGTPLRPADIRTSSHETQTLRLSDGSLLVVDASSALSVHFDEKKRRIKLHQGSAYFQPTDEDTRPFVVETPNGHVTDIGTAFNIRHRLHDSEIQVAEGIVDIFPKNGLRLRLHAGQAARYDEQQVQLLEEGETEIAAWRHGYLLFRQTPLNQVLAELEARQAGRIVLLSGSLAEHPVNARLRNDSGAQAVDALAQSLGLRVVRISPLLTLLYQEQEISPQL